MVKKTTPTKIWNIYQKYDYMGEKSEYKFLRFEDNGIGELGVYNKNTGSQIESISAGRMKKKEFVDLINEIIEKKPKNGSEWLANF